MPALSLVPADGVDGVRSKQEAGPSLRESGPRLTQRPQLGVVKVLFEHGMNYIKVLVWLRFSSLPNADNRHIYFLISYGIFCFSAFLSYIHLVHRYLLRTCKITSTVLGQGLSLPLRGREVRGRQMRPTPKPQSQFPMSGGTSAFRCGDSALG